MCLFAYCCGTIAHRHACVIIAKLASCASPLVSGRRAARKLNLAFGLRVVTPSTRVRFSSRCAQTRAHNDGGGDGLGQKHVKSTHLVSVYGE